MERCRLTDDIWWVGAIDWNVRDFHGYETPRGSTYNAYLITDEKMTVVDTVRDGFGPEMLQRLQVVAATYAPWTTWWSTTSRWTTPAPWRGSWIRSVR